MGQTPTPQQGFPLDQGAMLPLLTDRSCSRKALLAARAVCGESRPYGSKGRGWPQGHPLTRLDQAEPANQTLLWHQRQCRQDSGMVAVCVHVLVAILRKELVLELSLSLMLQVLSVNVFEQVTLVELFTTTASQDEALDSRNQLMLWN